MKKLTYIILTALLSFVPAVIHAQNLVVESFELAPTDITANTPGTTFYDQNGDVCALIKVETTQKGFTFDVGVLGVTTIVEHPAEIWVYVPFGVRKITIQHSHLGMLRDYVFPCTIQRGRTYIMKLSSGKVRTIVENAPTKQFLSIELNPADAILEINGRPKIVENGIYEELLPFGTYTYKAYSQNYYDATGTVQVNDPRNTHKVKLNLKPAFGYLSILSKQNNELNGAAVHIDNKYIGTIPVQNLQLGSGKHTITVLKEMYEPFTESIEIADEDRLVYYPNMVPDFAEVTLQTASGAEIYINGKLKGRGTVKDKLPSGSYNFESRQSGHISTQMSYDITRHDHNKTILIPDPTPIYGSLAISSSPTKAKIIINASNVGETPKYFAQQVIGEYTITAQMDGYKSQVKKVAVTEGNETSVSFILEKAPAKTSTTTTTTTRPGTSSTTSSKTTPSKNVTTITSKDATVYVGQTIKAVLPDGAVEKWELDYVTKEFVKIGSDPSTIIAIKPGTASVWGYVKGIPKLIRLKIEQGTGRNTSYSTSIQSKYIMRSATFTVKVGDTFSVVLPEGPVTQWKLSDAHKQYVSQNNQVLRAIKKGTLQVWGYVNGTPKCIYITIN